MKSITTDKAPKAVGPYSQAVTAGEFVFCSGQIALNPKTGELVKGGIKAQTAQVLKNLNNVLQAAGASIASVVSVNVYLARMSDFADMNAEYAKIFSASVKPARVTVGVLELPKNALVEISCVAVKSARGRLALGQK